jgi:hypothetical protein
LTKKKLFKEVHILEKDLTIFIIVGVLSLILIGLITYALSHKLVTAGGSSIDCSSCGTWDEVTPYSGCPSNTLMKCHSGNYRCNYCAPKKNQRAISCCDGTRVWAAPGEEDSACANHGGYGHCDPPCWCESFNIACGYHCSFPSSTQQEVDDAAKAHCGVKYMAFCDFDGQKASIHIRPAGNCWEHRNVCKNPTAYYAKSSACPPPTPTMLLYCIEKTKNGKPSNKPKYWSCIPLSTDPKHPTILPSPLPGEKSYFETNWINPHYKP